MRISGGLCPGVHVQALRAEVESRRVLLANQELSLRERELALERRESGSGAASATARLAAATAAAQAELRKKQQQEEEEEAKQDTRMAEEPATRQLTVRPSPVERFWPPTSDQGVDAVESSDGVEVETTAIEPSAPAQGVAPREEARGGKDAPGQPPTHSFRCVCVIACATVLVFGGRSQNVCVEIK